MSIQHYQRVGFTGTREGMTVWQVDRVSRWLRECLIPNPDHGVWYWSPEHLGFHAGLSFHHGDCIGADARADAIIDQLNTGRELRDRIEIVIHAPVVGTHRAWCGWEQQGLPDSYRRWCPPKTHFARNRDIVGETQITLATPLKDLGGTTLMERLGNRGGTAYTCEHTLKAHHPLLVFWPDGTTSNQLAL